MTNTEKMAQVSGEHLEESRQAFKAGSHEESMHELRRSIDALIEWTAEIKGNSRNYGREMALVHTKLQEAKMWAGKCLEKLGSELPEEYRDKASV